MKKYVATVKMVFEYCSDAESVLVFHRKIDARKEEDRQAIKAAKGELSKLYKACPLREGSRFRRMGFTQTYVSGRLCHRWGWCPECHQITTTVDGFCGPICKQRVRSRKRAAERKAARTAARPPRACGYCGDKFTPKRNDARFCSPKCRVYANRAKK